jgi:feruloyl esterase
LKDLDFDRDQRRFDEAEALYNAGNPDLRDFQATGGKFLAFQGWADTSVVPMAYIDYYETLTRTMGGTEKTTEFFRLFTIPGMRHCSADGLGAEAINYLEVLENWVERGQAPNVLIGASVDWGGPIRRSPTYPIDPAQVRFTRPAYLYPAVPIYKGMGDPNSADSFRPSTD